MTIRRRAAIGGALPLAAVRTTHAQSDWRPLLTVRVAQVPSTLGSARELSNIGTRVTYARRLGRRGAGHRALPAEVYAVRKHVKWRPYTLQRTRKSGASVAGAARRVR